jgi:porin
MGLRTTIHIAPVFLIASWVALASLPAPALSQETSEDSWTRGLLAYQNIPRFGGPSSVGGTLEEDAADTEPVFTLESMRRSLQSYFDFKERMQEEHGFAFGFDYTAMVQGASESLGEDRAAGGIFRLFGTWTLLGHGTPNTGSIVYKVENRHRLGTDIPPAALGFETGYVGLTAPIYSDYDWGLTNLYWQQRFNDGRFTFVAGVVDVTDYVATYGMVNPWTSFSNLAFLTDPTIPAPNQGLGAAAGAMLTDQIYLIAGLADTNGDPTDPGDMIDSFFDDREYFKHVELGWTPSKDRIYLDNVHLTYWHADEREAAQTPDGWGLSFSAAKFFDDKWMPFLRAGYAEDGGALYERSVGAGLGYYRKARGDLFGVGLNWSRPSESSFGPDLDDQYTAELFYRFQLTDNLAITPDIQFIVDPTLNPEEDRIWVLGLRARLAL